MLEALISVITPSFNSQKFIKDAVGSVLIQTYQNWEMIIVDDCSTDDTLSILEKLSKTDSRIQIFKNEINRGAAYTRNVAIKQSRGDFIAFLDSDDTWYPKKLELQLNFMLEKNYSFTYTYYDLLNENGNKLNEVIKTDDKVDYDSMLKYNKIGCLTVMINSSFLGDVEMPDIRKRQDYALWLKLLKLTDYAYCLSITLSSYRSRSNSISSNKLGLVKYNWILYRNIEEFSFLKSFYFLSRNIYFKLIK